MPKVTSESFTQLYSRVVQHRGSEARVSGGKGVAISEDGQISTSRFGRSADKRRAAHIIYGSIKQEFGKATADRVFREVTGDPVGRELSLAELKAIKANLRFEKPLDLADRSNAKPARFSRFMSNALDEAERRDLSGSKHVRFKGSKGLYFHRASLGSAIHVGNWLSGESPIDKRQDAGAKVWQMLANEMGAQEADNVFRSVFGDTGTSQGGQAPRVAVTLDQLRQINAEVEQRAPHVAYQKLSPDDEQAARRRLTHMLVPRKAALSTLSRLYVLGRQSDMDNLELHRFEQGAKAAKMQVEQTNVIGTGVHGKPRFTDHSEPPVEPRTDYQRKAADLYRDNPMGAVQAYGDALLAFANANKLNLSNQEQRDLNLLADAASAAMGLARNRDGQTYSDVGLSQADINALQDLAKITSMVRNHKDGKLRLTPETVRDYKRLLGHIGAHFKERLETEAVRDRELRNFGGDLKELTGSSGSGQPDIQTPLRRWHDLKAQRDTLNSDMDVLAGHPAQDAMRNAAKVRSKGSIALKKLNEQLNRVTGKDQKSELKRTKIRGQMADYQAEIDRANLREKIEIRNYKAVCQKHGVPLNNDKARQNKLNELGNRALLLMQQTNQAKAAHVDDPKTQEMVQKYGRHGFKADVDYLQKGAEIDLPMLQNQTVATMKAAMHQGIPLLLEELDQADAD